MYKYENSILKIIFTSMSNLIFKYVTGRDGVKLYLSNGSVLKCYISSVSKHYISVSSSSGNSDVMLSNISAIGLEPR